METLFARSDMEKTKGNRYKLPISATEDFLACTDLCFKNAKTLIVSEYKVNQEIKTNKDQQARLWDC